jgi:hypothetical protein
MWKVRQSLFKRQYFITLNFASQLKHDASK